MSWRLDRRMYRIAAVLVILFGLSALARVGGGEHYTGSSDSNDSNSVDPEVIFFILRLLIEYPQIGVPVLIIAVIVFVVRMRSQGDGSTQKAIARAEAQTRTRVSGEQVAAWVATLQKKDPQFQLLPMLDLAKRLFLEIQEAWFQRNLLPVRRHLSDATFQRLTTQLEILRAQGVRDAIADPEVVDLQLIGLEQSEAFDTVHVRVQARLRDTDVPSGMGDEDARRTAKAAALESFVEVWSFVRKPGVQTKAGDDGFQGKCPSCGAPFQGGASNRCEHCSAVVNSGNYAWVLAEITQGQEFNRGEGEVPGVSRLRQVDPGFNTEVLEDRASLAFWRWIEAQSLNEPQRAARVVSPAVRAQLDQAVAELKAQAQRRLYLQCAVGAVMVRRVDLLDQVARAYVEVRWSASLAFASISAPPPRPGAPMPHRSVLVLERAASAQTNAGNGMATSNCVNCGAPQGSSSATVCEFCAAPLVDQGKDWVLVELMAWEAFSAQRAQSTASPAANKVVPDREERERLLYMMAAIAAADGNVDAKERELLEMSAQRWGVARSNLELAIASGPKLFERLVARATPEAEAFLQQLVDLAKLDGSVDRREKQMLELAAHHLGLDAKLGAMLAR